LSNSRIARVLLTVAILNVIWIAGCRSKVASSSAAAGRKGLTPCGAPQMPAEALCGTYEVFENRAARTGHKIPLHIVVLPATGPHPLPDPFTYFAGGPGASSITEGVGVAQWLGPLRQERDLFLVDFRGTGQSGGLFCSEIKDAEDVQGFLDDFLATDSVHACRDRLMKEADLSWYTTDAAIDDVEEVRTALGYGQLNLIGNSHGTRAVLTYLQRHPQSIRTATLDGVLPPEARSLLNLASASQEALDGLIAECEGDPACKGAFPNLRQEIDAVLHTAATEPPVVTVLNPAARRPLSLRLSLPAVAQTLRYMLYSPAEAALVPLQVHLAAQGDWKALARSALTHGHELSQTAEGFFLSVTCAEDVALIGDDEIEAAVANTFLGDFRIRRQRAACEGWPIRDPARDVPARVASDVPALLISGERDPVTPASYGERAAQPLKNARRVVIADGSHDLVGMRGEDCEPAVIAAFIKSGTTEGLDVSCIATLRRPDFELPAVTVAKADLQLLPGSFAAKEMPVAVRVALEGDRLRLYVTQGPPLPPAQLIPTSSLRFRCEADGWAPGLALTFQVSGGKATQLVLVQPGKPELILRRTD